MKLQDALHALHAVRRLASDRGRDRLSLAVIRFADRVDAEGLDELAEARASAVLIAQLRSALRIATDHAHANRGARDLASRQVVHLEDMVIELQHANRRLRSEQLASDRGRDRLGREANRLAAELADSQRNREEMAGLLIAAALMPPWLADVLRLVPDPKVTVSFAGFGPKGVPGPA